MMIYQSIHQSIHSSMNAWQSGLLGISVFCVVCVHDTAQVAMRQIALGQIASPHPLRLTEARTVGLCEDFGGVSLSRIWRERCPEIHSRAFCTQCSVAPSVFAQPTIGDLAIAQSSTSRRPPFTNACTGCHRMSCDWWKSDEEIGFPWRHLEAFQSTLEVHWGERKPVAEHPAII